MSGSQPLKLMTTLGCHLCEYAESMLQSLLRSDPVLEGKFEVQAVEIADSESLVERYGARIPVLVLDGDGEELGWPFEIDELRSWLNQ